jgi:hypothetical protein
MVPEIGHLTFFGISLWDKKVQYHPEIQIQPLVKTVPSMKPDRAVIGREHFKGDGKGVSCQE